MVYETIISCNELLSNLDNPDWVVVDCRYRLDDSRIGYLAYQNNHISGAVYADLEKDLTGEIVKGVTGRHPLPTPEEFVAKLEEWGVDRTTQVVVYDDKSGAFAARLWWMLPWVGHEAVALLNGGWQFWQKCGYPTRHGIEINTPRKFIPNINQRLIVTTEQILNYLHSPSYQIIDARESERYLGIHEPIDPIAGHIPGAYSLPYTQNITSQGLIKDPTELRKKFYKNLPEPINTQIVMYCGSGVTAALNVIVMKYAGLGDAKLYVGSWSEWITDPNRPVAIDVHRNTFNSNEGLNE